MPPPPRPPAGRPPLPPKGNAPPGRPVVARPGAPPAAVRPGGPVRPGAPVPRPGGTTRQPTPAQAQKAAEEELERRFDRVERRIEQLKVDYYRFFAGDLKQPPVPVQDEIQAEMRKLRAINMRRSVDSFRYGALEARLNSYAEMFGRKLRNLEEGKVAPRHPSRPEMPRHDVDAGVVVSPRLESDAVEALFQGLVNRNPRGANMDLDTFRTYLERQLAQIRDKTGCAAVQFRVVDEEGKVKLKAKPVGAAGG